MDSLIGMASKDYVLLAADTMRLQSIIVVNDHEKKMFHITKKFVMAASGEAGDCVHFSEFIQKNVTLYRIRNGYDLSASEIATYTRRSMSEYLRTRESYSAEVLMAGYDEKEGAVLYFMDVLGSLVKMPFAAHGFGSFFAISMMDRYHNLNLRVEEAYDVLKKCISEIHRRLIINQPNFAVKIVDKDGIRDLPAVTRKHLLNEALQNTP